MDAYPPIAAASVGVSTLAAQLASIAPDGWASVVPLLVQAGMAGVVVLLLLKFFPALIQAQKEQNERYLGVLEKQREAYTAVTESVRASNEKNIHAIIEAHERQMNEWRNHCLRNIPNR